MVFRRALNCSQEIFCPSRMQAAIPNAASICRRLLQLRPLWEGRFPAYNGPRKAALILIIFGQLPPLHKSVRLLFGALKEIIEPKTRSTEWYGRQTLPV